MLPSERFDKSEKIFIVILIAYFCLQVILRLVISSSFSLDESEQVLLAQFSFAWGYNGEPPLYTWMFLLLNLFMPPLAALTILKNSLLLTFYLFFYWTCKKFLSLERAIVCTSVLFFFPQISWEAQRDLSHSVLLLLACILTIFFLLRLRQQPISFNYAILGIVVGMGTLSKYSYWLFLLGVLAAVIAVRTFRDICFSKKIFYSILFAGIVAFGHYQWFGANFLQVQTALQNKLPVAPQTKNLFQGAGHLLGRLAVFLLPFVILKYCFFPQFSLLRKHKSDEITSFWEYAYGASFLVLLSITLLFSFTSFKVRWLLPFFFTVPCYIFYINRDKVINTLSLYRRVFYLTLAFLLLLMVGRIISASLTGKFHKLNYPFQRLAEKLKEDGFQEGNIVAADQLTGGNLRNFFPTSMVFTQDIKGVHSLPSRPTIFVWRREKEKPSFVSNQEKKLPIEVRFVESLYLYSRTKKMKLFFFELPNK